MAVGWPAIANASWPALRNCATTLPSCASGRARASTYWCRICLVCHGALDPHVPMTQVNAFVQEMNQADADWQLAVYGGAMRGFTHETGPAGPGVAYHALGHARSSPALQKFFRQPFG